MKELVEIIIVALFSVGILFAENVLIFASCFTIAAVLFLTYLHIWCGEEEK